MFLIYIKINNNISVATQWNTTSTELDYKIIHLYFPRSGEKSPLSSKLTAIATKNSLLLSAEVSSVIFYIRTIAIN